MMSAENKTIMCVSASSIFGGADKIFSDLINNLDRAEGIVHTELKEKHPFRETVSFIPFRGLNKNLKSVIGFLLHFIPTIFKLKRKVPRDRIILSNDLLALIYCFPVKYLQGNSLGFYCHAAFKHTLFNKLILSSFINLVSDKIIVPSHYLEKELTDIGVSAHKIRVIYNGIQSYEFPVSGHPEKKELSLGIFGGICDQKGQDTLVDALKKLSQSGISVKGWIVGGIYEKEFYDSLLIKLEKLPSLIEFSGFVPHEEAQKIMSNLDIVVCLSKYRETLPTSLLEAMSMKKSTIGTRVGGIPEIIENGMNGILIDPCDADQLGEAIKKLSDENTRNQFGNTGYAIFLRKFSRERFYADMQHELCA